MNVHQREFWAETIQEQAQAWGVGSATHSEIDQLGILPATRLAMQRALKQLSVTPDHLLIDALFLPDLNSPQTALIKGDQRSLSIAAASILAKTSRDALMRQEDKRYPLYGFRRHKGYGTRFHQQALAENGPCAIHRMSFRPLRELSEVN
jgi:ribonuclease HII